MFKKHKTKDGQVMMICEMDNQHLLNTIKVILKAIKSVIWTANINDDKGVDLYEQELYEYKKIDKKEAAKITKDLAAQIAPYILEAAIRGMIMDIEIDLQEAFNRKTMYIKKNPLLMIEQFHNDDGNDDNYYDEEDSDV